MNQTLFAFLAMIIAMMVARDQSLSHIQTYQNSVLSEFEIMANAVALEQTEIIQATTSWDNLEIWDGDTMNVNYSVDETSVPFTLGIDIQFVDDEGIPSPNPTTVKEVLVIAMSERFSNPVVTHSRLISQ